MRHPLLLLATAGCLSLQAQSLVTAPWSLSPTPDGHLSGSEWASAAAVRIPSLAGDTATALLMHDGSQLCVAFMGRLESAAVLFPELLLDVQHDAAATWQADDWWFHVSATDCETTGAYGGFSDCLAVQPDWTAVPNMTPGGVVTDTIELLIPFSKLGISAPDTLGFSLCLTNTSSIFKMWPTTSNRNNPSTWGTLVLADGATAQQAPAQQKSYTVSPNPSTDGSVWINGPADPRLTWTLMDVRGEIVNGGSPEGEWPWQVSLGGGGRRLPPGFYVLTLDVEGRREHHRLLVR